MKNNTLIYISIIWINFNLYWFGYILSYYLLQLTKYFILFIYKLKLNIFLNIFLINNIWLPEFINWLLNSWNPLIYNFILILIFTRFSLSIQKNIITLRHYDKWIIQPLNRLFNRIQIILIFWIVQFWICQYLLIIRINFNIAQQVICNIFVKFNHVQFMCYYLLIFIF